MSKPTDDRLENHEEHGGYGIYLLTWIALLIFTAITVSVAGMHLGKISLLVAVVIAGVKASMVLSNFMHLRDELPMFRVMFFVAILALTIFIGLTFFDPPLRS